MLGCLPGVLTLMKMITKKFINGGFLAFINDNEMKTHNGFINKNEMKTDPNESSNIHFLNNSFLACWLYFGSQTEHFRSISFGENWKAKS